MIRGRFSSGACALEKNNPLFPEGYSLIQLSSSGLVVKPEHGAWREYHRDQLTSLGFVVKSKLEKLNTPVEVSLVPWDCVRGAGQLLQESRLCARPASPDRSFRCAPSCAGGGGKP